MPRAILSRLGYPGPPGYPSAGYRSPGYPPGGYPGRLASTATSGTATDAGASDARAATDRRHPMYPAGPGGPQPGIPYGSQMRMPAASAACVRPVYRPNGRLRVRRRRMPCPPRRSRTSSNFCSKSWVSPFRHPRSTPSRQSTRGGSSGTAAGAAGTGQDLPLMDQLPPVK